ncbi:hypothetical protein GCM10009665_23870 [Kitasatospora nipponensis]|uniref:Glucose-6-phosphate isomerase n=1 Tax=Kitasatospora nipponensis TaxID=258049 RepID=A0ABN1W2P0_9ACTN
MSAAVAPSTARAVRALAALPWARSCGLTELLCRDAESLARGELPALRVAVCGSAGAGELLAWLHAELAGPVGRPAAVRVECSREAVDSHLLLLVVPDLPAATDPAPQTEVLDVLGSAHPPTATVVVDAPDDWAGAGLATVAGWHRRHPGHPGPAGLPVHAVVLGWRRSRPAACGLPELWRRSVLPVLADAPELLPALTRARLRCALQELRLAARGLAAEAGLALDPGGRPVPAADLDPPADPASRAVLWQRLDALATGPLALRAVRQLDRSVHPGEPHEEERS